MVSTMLSMIFLAIFKAHNFSAHEGELMAKRK